MQFEKLQLDRFLDKSASQNDETKSAVYTSVNPAPKQGEDMFKKIGRPNGSEEDDGAKNVLTGTVITSCFIQTSALPSRIEMEGNNITFYDDTFERDGQVVGDTSRLVFTHDLNSNEGFILEKRASIHNTYDNVLSWYATPAKAGAHNYLFIGRDGRDTLITPNERNLHHFTVAINEDSSVIPDPTNAYNGIFSIEFSIDKIMEGAAYKPINVGGSQYMLVGSGLTGMSAFIVGGGGGVVALAYVSSANPNDVIPGLYMLSDTQTSVGAHLIPDAPSTYDLGSPGFPFRAIYVDSLSIASISTGGIIFTPRDTDSSTVGELYYYDDGITEGLRMRINGFTLQFQADIV